MLAVSLLLIALKVAASVIAGPIAFVIAFVILALGTYALPECTQRLLTVPIRASHIRDPLHEHPVIEVKQ